MSLVNNKRWLAEDVTCPWSECPADTCRKLNRDAWFKGNQCVADDSNAVVEQVISHVENKLIRPKKF